MRRIQRRNQPAMGGRTAESYNGVRKEIPAAMKRKSLLQTLILLTLLFSLIGIKPVSANTVPPPGGVLQTGASISITLQPGRLSLHETATGTVSLQEVPPGGYTSAEFTCTYRADLVQVSDILVS